MVYGRVNKLRLLGFAAEGGAALLGLPTFGLIRKGIEGVGDYVSGDADEEDAKAVKEAAGDVREKAKSLLSAKEKRSPPEEITAFRSEFEEVLKGLDKTLVVGIDNIDRCTPPNAIHTWVLTPLMKGVSEANRFTTVSKASMEAQKNLQ